MKKLSPYQNIPTQEALDTLLNTSQSPLDCFIFLNGGLRSSKNISYDDNGDYIIYNEIDDSEETILHSTFLDSFIGKAMTAGALYKY